MSNGPTLTVTAYHAVLKTDDAILRLDPIDADYMAIAMCVKPSKRTDIIERYNLTDDQAESIMDDCKRIGS